jgi:hypothetical protein
MMVADGMSRRNGSLLMVCLLSLVIIICGDAAHGQGRRDDRISVNIAARMAQDGVVDENRLFIFEITYSPKGQHAPELCEVISVTVNNVACRAGQSLGEGRGIWIKPEFANPDYWGRENMKCTTVALSGGLRELTVNINDIGGGAQMTHRVFVKNGRLIDYRGTLVKSSVITNRIETAEYRPVRSQEAWSSGWQDSELGCARMAIPVVVGPRQ